MRFITSLSKYQDHRILEECYFKLHPAFDLLESQEFLTRILLHEYFVWDRGRGHRSGPRVPLRPAVGCELRHQIEIDPGTTQKTVTKDGVINTMRVMCEKIFSSLKILPNIKYRDCYFSSLTNQRVFLFLQPQAKETNTYKPSRGERRDMLTRLHASISTSRVACAAATSRASSANRRPRGVESSLTTTQASSLSAALVSSSREAGSGEWDSGAWGSFSGTEGISASSLGAVVSLTLLWFSGKLMLHSLSKRN